MLPCAPRSALWETGWTDRENDGADVVILIKVRAVFVLFKLRSMVVDVTNLSIIHRYVIITSSPCDDCLNTVSYSNWNNIADSKRSLCLNIYMYMYAYSPTVFFTIFCYSSRFVYSCHCTDFMNVCHSYEPLYPNHFIIYCTVFLSRSRKMNKWMNECMNECINE